MKKHFVEFYSPGTLVSEVSTEPVDSWDIDVAIQISKSIRERHSARPYGFCFITRERGENDLDSHISERSNLYYLGGRIETWEEIEARNDPNEKVLRSNMRINNIDKVIVNNNPWRFTAALKEGDVVLDVNLRET